MALVTDMAELAHRPVVLFDFDGTVVDTAPAITSLASAIMVEHGVPRAAQGDLMRMVGPPLEEGFAVCGGFDAATSDALAKEYRRRFARDVTPEQYPVIPGIRELLDALVAAGRHLAVATSRMEDSAQGMVEAQGLTQFEVVAGRRPAIGRETKAQSIRAALEALGVPSGDAVMVGDREHDVAGAHAEGVPCIGFYSGTASPGEFERAGAEAVCTSVAQIAATLGVALA